MIDRLTDSLEQYMNVVSLRQKLVASNIANADTPGYKTQDLDFQSSFQSALDGGSPQPAEVTGPATKTTATTWIWTAKPACWPKTPCVSTSPPT